MSDRPYIVDDGGSPGGRAHGELVSAVRSLIDAVAACEAPEEAASSLVPYLEYATNLLTPYARPRTEAPAGNRADLPGEGHPAMPPTRMAWEAEAAHGRVRFTRAHDGGGGAVHGGWLPLIYDDVLGRLASRIRPRSRTAFLHVDYRSITPVGVDLTLETHLDRVDGRKIWLTGSMHDGDRLLTEARGLFVILKPGQP